MNENDELHTITVILMRNIRIMIYILIHSTIFPDKLTALYGEAKSGKRQGSLYGYCDSEGEALNLGQVKV